MSILDKKIKEACELTFNPKISYSGKVIREFAKEQHEIYSSIEDKTQVTSIESFGEEVYKYIYRSDGTDNMTIMDSLYYFVSYDNNNGFHMYKLSFVVDHRHDLSSNEDDIDNETIKKIFVKINNDIKYAVDEAESASDRFMFKDGNYIDGVNPTEIQEWFDKYLDYYMINGFTSKM